ncbi:MAG: hypothetical protein QG657_923 [Acidobacteriota bacterium]|nr:hypothetical protein [Acidobacteriota bacterium]
MKTKISYLCLPIIVSVLLILSFGSCKNFGIPDYKLTVVIGPGVNGTPPTGVTTHKELDTIDYEYKADDSNYQVEVLVNDSVGSSAGKFVMYTDLNVVAQIFDIRDTWDFTLEETADGTVEKREFTVTFTGNSLLSGDFTDSTGHYGAWIIDDTDLTMTYSNWLDYKLTSTSVTGMAGTWSGEEKSSSWSASRTK